MERPKFLRYISEKDSEYESYKEKKERPGEEFHGQWSVQEYERILETQSGKEDFIEQKEAVFNMERRYMHRYLTETLDEKKFKEYYFRIFQEALESDQIKAKLAQIIDLENDFSTKTIGEYIIQKKIDDKLLAEILRNHGRIFQEKKTEMEAVIEKFTQEFIDEAEALIESGYLPMSKELLKRRISETKVVVKDYMDMMGTPAQYDPWVININVDYVFNKGAYSDYKDSIRHAYFHEMTHAAIGGRIMKQTHLEGWQTKDIEHVKNGLGIRRAPRKGEFFPKLNFEALNEAITEEIAIKLSKSGGHYISERWQYLDLIQKGVPEELFVAAYCENYDPEKQTKLDAWHALIKRIKEVEGKVSPASKL